jgi:predicted membrane protein
VPFLVLFLRTFSGAFPCVFFVFFSGVFFWFTRAFSRPFFNMGFACAVVRVFSGVFCVVSYFLVRVAKVFLRS